MAKVTRKMKETTKRFIMPYRKRDKEYNARIGNFGTNETRVSGTQYTFWVTMEGSGQPLQAINRTGAVQFGYPVKVGYDARNPRQLCVLYAAPTYGNVETPADGVPPHGNDHSWRNGQVQGKDITYVWSEQFMRSLAFPSPTSLTIYIYPGEYRTATGWVHKGKHGVDMTASIPGTAGKARWSMIVVTSAGAWAVRDGALVTGYDNLSDADKPEPTDGDNCLWLVKCFYGQTFFRMTAAISDLVDVRFSGADSGTTAAIPAHGSTHISTGDDPVPDVVSGGASGLMTGADKAKLDNYTAYPYLQVTEDLTAQIDGSTDHFDISAAAFGLISVYANLRQRPGDVTPDADNLGFTLSYVPTASDTCVVDYAASFANILFDTVSGLPLTDDNGNLLEA